MMTATALRDDPKVQKHRWYILIAVGLFTFMSTLDGSIVNIALPVISKDMQVSMSQAEHIVSVYLMAVCACLLLFGKIGDSIGKIKIFKIGTGVFVFGSFLCGLHLSLTFLLFARVVQAIGASMTMATNSGIITEVFPVKERGRALGMIGSFVSLGSIAGPGVGGMILASLGWSYIFWINVPIGLLTILLGKVMLPKDVDFTRKKIDYPGFITFALFITCFFGSIFIGQEIGFTKWLVILLFIFSIVALCGFVYLEKRTKEPLVSFKLFHNKLFTISLITAVLIFVSNFFCNVILPFYLENARGIPAHKAGLMMMTFPLVMMVFATVSGYLTDKMGPRLLTLIGLCIITISQFSYSFLDLHSPFWLFIIVSAGVGLGNGLFQSPNNTIVMSAVAKQDLGIAGSINSLARNFGMVTGITLSTTVLYNAMSFKYGHKVTSYLNDRPDIFIFGLKVAFLSSFVVCLIATLLTLYRFIKTKQEN